jgi:chromate transporter
MAEETATTPTNRATSAYREVARFFLRLGFTAFGGPAAHIAMMEAEVVRGRAWVTREEFLDLLGAANLIPGPTSTELAIYLGYRRAGWPGLFLGGLCFILPAALITLGLAWAYARFHTLPSVTGLLYGIKAAIIAVVAQALWGLGRTAVKSRFLAALALLATMASFFEVNPLAILLAAGLLAMAAGKATQRTRFVVPAILGLGPGLGLAAPVVGTGILASVSLAGLFWAFLKVGALLYGSGYVLLALLRADLVERLHWLTDTQLLDAIAVGQFTPGPVFTTATFIGYLVKSWTGAGVATLGIFLPSFVLVAASGPLLKRLQKSAVARAFLDGVNVAALALMATVTWHLGRSALIDWPTVAIALGSLFLLLRFRINSFWLVLAGGVAGLGKWWLS